MAHKKVEGIDEPAFVAYNEVTCRFCTGAESGKTPASTFDATASPTEEEDEAVALCGWC